MAAHPAPGNATVGNGKVGANEETSKAVKLGVGVLRRVMRSRIFTPSSPLPYPYTARLKPSVLEPDLHADCVRRTPTNRGC